MRLLEEAKLFLNILFQSTHSLRSATTLQSLLFCRINVSIHALLAECDKEVIKADVYKMVSIHALLAECDCFVNRFLCHVLKFQSTHSLRSATSSFFHLTCKMAVSIHALLAECDQLIISLLLIATCFNPRTPCGVRPFKEGLCALTNPFQSTHSLRSATSQRSGHSFLPQSFNPRTPCGVRLSSPGSGNRLSEFQSTHSLRSATLENPNESREELVSIHALLAECDCA